MKQTIAVLVAIFALYGCSDNTYIGQSIVVISSNFELKTFKTGFASMYCSNHVLVKSVFVTQEDIIRGNDGRVVFCELKNE